MNNLDQNTYYATSDLALTAAISLFYTIEDIDHTDPRKIQFLFKKDSNLDQLVKDFWNGKLKLNPLAYFNQLKIIKARIYGER